VEEIVVVHYLAVDTPLSLKKSGGRTSRCAGRWLTSLDARVDHVITNKKSLFDLEAVCSCVAFNAARLRGYGAEVNDEARGGSRQTFAQGRDPRIVLLKSASNIARNAGIDFAPPIHANPAGGKRTLDEVAKEFLKSRAAMGVRPRTLTQYESYLRTIGERFGNRPISEVRSGEIEEWLAESDWSKRTRNNYVSTLSTLFIFASDRDYCLGNPAEKIPRAILDDSAPGILTVEQVAQLLKVTREEDPGMLAYVAIGLFAGLRRSELCALEWSEIDSKARTIEVITEPW
jgi:Phage integrase, N-terminal SAM-like domain